MALNRDEEKQTDRQARIAALVVAGSMLFWLAAQVFGPKLGIAGNYAILIDLATMAALAWALVVAYRAWRKRRDN